ncbi:hypothetical protein [Caulobacter sp. 17J65-9]|uniref:hypothetical protein n=1 Tax=Caulobacter sp. 17J65-9 TaxID=2709382 RepID=UPI001969F08F|nr:hypothetical protein [Caulobacter sp. 17J65-9]
MTGLDVWRAHFEGFEDRYVLVGGVACDLVMDEVGLEFRATKDMDVVLIVEALDGAFAERFWAFVEAGGYEQRERSDGKKSLYRFQRPTTPGYPVMIELFSRAPDGLELGEDSQLTPLPIDETVASLSAILLDESYYGLLKANMRRLEGLPLLDEVALIPFKAKAFMDLSARRAAGEKVDQKDVRKHRNDVFRLMQLLAADAVYELPEGIAGDMADFVRAVQADEIFDPKGIGLRQSAEEALARLCAAYGVVL